MKLARTMFMTLAVLAVSALLYADDPYRSGYLEGVKHGISDKEAGFEFNYSNDLAYQAGISRSAYTNAEYREGYKDGYTDGFRKPVVDRGTVEFTSEADAFKFGYNQGHNHGSIDSQSGRSFNYTDNPRFSSGLTFHTYRSAQYRSGYKEGYEEGFSQEPTQESTRTIEITPVESSDSTVRVYVDRSGSSSVTVFTDSEFRGQAQSLSVGRYPYLEDWKNEIESIQMSGNVRVILFDQNNFQGQSVVLDEDTTDLADFDFNRRAASMMIIEAAQ